MVLLPKFETQGMVTKRTRRPNGKVRHRKLGSKSARAMCTLSHFRFRQFLEHKQRSHPWCRVIICDEPYTTQACGRCGGLWKEIGSSKQYACQVPGCGYTTDRDVNASRNVLLKYLSDNGKC